MLRLALWGTFLSVWWLCFAAVQAISLVDRAEYDALEMIYDATDGKHWSWSPNYLRDGIPWSFNDYENNNPCRQLWQGLYCLPNENECQTTPCHIFTIDVHGKNLSGQFPDVLSTFSQLFFVTVAENQLTGPLPTLRDLPTLLTANFSYNNFTGSIPDTFFNLSSLYLLYLSNNHLTGTIPSSIYREVRGLQYLNYYNNSINGTLSTEIALLDKLIFLSATGNDLQGTIPPQLFQLQNLSELYLSDNYLSGSLPTNLGQRLEVLRLDNNYFVGTISSSLCANSKLQALTLSANFFHGSFPDCISQLSKLSLFQIQDNHFTGKLENVFNSTMQRSLRIVDISDNGFGGSIPSELFKLPALQNLAAGKNCFQGTLPSTICEASPFLQVIALDGLGASDDCVSELWDPFHLSQAYFGGLLDGTIPDCIWTLPNVTTIHLAGNGLTGTLPSFDSCPQPYSNTEPCGLTPTLADVVLTHNLFKGTIPGVFQRFPFDVIDFSYNKFKGKIEDMTNLSLAYSPTAEGASVNLEVNRLTGRIPSSFIEAYNINILNGNIFACDRLHDDLAKHDPSSKTAICGAEQFVGAMSTFVIYVFFVVLIVIAIYLYTSIARRSIRVVVKSIRAITHTIRYCHQVAQYALPSSTEELEMLQSPQYHHHPDRLRQYYNIYQLLSALTLIRRISLVVLAYSLLICLPTYVAFYRWKNNHYSTHTDRYSWISSAVFLTGQLPALVLFFLWTVLLLIILWMIVYHYKLHHVRSNLGDETASTLMSQVMEAVQSASVKVRDSFRSTKTVVFNPRPSEYSYVPVMSNQQEEMVNPIQEPLIAESTRSVEERKEGTSLPSSGVDEAALDLPVPSPAAPEAVGEEASVSERSSIRPAPSLYSRLSNKLFGRGGKGSDDAAVALEDVHSDRIAPMMSIDDMSQLLQEQKRKEFWMNFLRFSIVIIINVTVMMTINVGYLLAENDKDLSAGDKSLIQIGMAMFKIFWNIFALRILITQLPFQKASVKLHVGMLVFNSIFAPCLATTFSDSDCFRDVFVAAPAITVSYNLTTCVESYQAIDYNKGGEVETVCTHYFESEIETAFTPSFIYYYTCAAKLLTVYTPVFIYIYTILVTFLPIMYTLFASWRTDYIPLFLLRQLDGAIRPHDRGIVVFDKLVRARPMQAIMVHHLIVLLCFGVACPMLAVVMTATLTVDTLMWQIILTRYIKYETKSAPFHPNYRRPRGASGESGVSLHNRWSDFSVTSQSLGAIRSAIFGGGEARQDTAHPVPTSAPMTPLVSPIGDYQPPPPPSPAEATTATATATAEGNASTSMPPPPPVGSPTQPRGMDDVLYKLLFPTHHISDNSGPEGNNREREDSRIDEQVKEEARLYELHTVCGEAWKTIYASMWQIMYISCFFYSLILFNMAGDESSWGGALWVPGVLVTFAAVVRFTFVDIIKIVYGRLIGGYVFRATLYSNQDV